ncbi:hypothetical protein, partial [Faecalibaculum rodentium]
MMEEEQPPHVGIRTSLSETYEEIRLILRDGFDGQVLIHEHLLLQKLDRLPSSVNGLSRINSA